MKKILTSLLLFAGVVALVFVSAACVPVDTKTSKIDTIRISEGGELRILQLTDIHLTASELETIADLRAAGFAFGPVSGITAYLRDQWALQTVATLIEETQPDFIVVTGDIVYTNPYTQFLTPIGHTDNLKAMKMFAEYIESYKIPWAATLGNHDHEGTSSREQIADYLASLEYCLFQKGPSNITGFGNYIINVLNSDGTYNTALVMMDSNSYRDPDDHTGFSSYDSIHDNQIEWYEQSLNDIKAKYGLPELPQSLLFCHIPVNEFATARDIYVQQQAGNMDNPDLIVHDGFFGEKNYAVSVPAIGEYKGVYYDGGRIFDKILELGSTKGIFVGHDHANNIILEYLGVLFVFGKSIDYIAYPTPDICKNDDFRGGTLITIKDKSPFVYDGEDNKPVELIPYSGGLYAAYKAAN